MTTQLRAVESQPKLDIRFAIHDEMKRLPQRSVEHDALELALQMLGTGAGVYRARRSLQLMQRIARKLSKPLATFERLRGISDRPSF